MEIYPFLTIPVEKVSVIEIKDAQLLLSLRSYCHCHFRYILGMMPAREFLRQCILQHRHTLSSMRGGVGMSCCCTAPSFNHALLKKRLEEKFNNPVALEVTEYVAVFQVLITTKYREKVTGTRVLGRSAKFHAIMPRSYHSSPTILAKYYITFPECMRT